MLSLVGQVGCAGIGCGAVAAVQAGDLGRFAGEDGAGLVLDPGLGDEVALAVEAPGRFPEVFQHVDEVDQDGDSDVVLVCFGPDAVDLVVAVDERDPGALMTGVPAPGLVEDLPDHCGGGFDEAGGEPLVYTQHGYELMG